MGTLRRAVTPWPIHVGHPPPGTPERATCHLATVACNMDFSHHSGPTHVARHRPARSVTGDLCSPVLNERVGVPGAAAPSGPGKGLLSKAWVGRQVSLAGPAPFSASLTVGPVAGKGLAVHPYPRLRSQHSDILPGDPPGPKPGKATTGAPTLTGRLRWAHPRPGALERAPREGSER